MIDMNTSKEELQKLLEEVLSVLYDNDKFLIDNKGPCDIDFTHNHERAIVHKFGSYLNEILNKNNYVGYHLDFEYNRNLYERKKIKKNGVIPDLIIHKRGDNSFNLLVIEFKTWWDKDIKKDIKKLKGFVSLKGSYKYKFGLSMIFEKELKDTKNSFVWLSENLCDENN